MSKHTHLTTFLLFLGFLSLLVGCGRSSELSVRQRGELVVEMDDEMPGYFMLGGEGYGYQYDLFKAYADYLGVGLRIVRGDSIVLKQEVVDIIATLATHVNKEQMSQAVLLYNSSYVLLSNGARAAEARQIPNFDPIPFLKGSRLLIPSGLQGTVLYETLVDSLSGADIYVSSGNIFDMMELIREGKYDFLICELSEAQLGGLWVHGIEQVYAFDEPLVMSAVITSKEQREEFKMWLLHFRTSGACVPLNDLYFNRGIVWRVRGQGLTAGDVDRISSYDDLFRDLCKDTDYDWRLISAIAYSESHFNPHIVSYRGAEGLMQVMPYVARRLGVQGDMTDPEHNILAALKLLDKIEETLDFAPDTPFVDRMKIMLACYNAGISHLLDARRLARKYGLDPDSWDDVSACLGMKSDPELVKDDGVKFGRFNSSQTIAFVNEVFSKYTSYCANISQ